MKKKEKNLYKHLLNKNIKNMCTYSDKEMNTGIYIMWDNRNKQKIDYNHIETRIVMG